jgi:biotin carboxyl carrier protein
MPIYRIVINGNEYTVAVPNPRERPIRAIVNGETIEVTVENNSITTAPATSSNILLPAQNVTESASRQQPTTPNSVNTTGASNAVKSPLPGIIVSISVAEGDRVESGQELCVLEAMKMNNPIRATVSGIVTKIFVSIGQQVQHGVPLMVIEV